MSRTCEICGKGTSFGNRIARRGMAKYKGGVGIKLTGITRRRFKANIQNVHVEVNGARRRMRVCAQCIRSGKIKKLA